MSSTVVSSSTIRSSSAPASTTSVTPIGVFQGQNPIVYSPTDPLILFCVQVSLGIQSKLIFVGFHHSCDMSYPSLPSIQNPATPSHRRSHRYQFPFRNPS